MRRLLPPALAGMFALVLLASSAAVATKPATAAPIATTPTVYCGDPDTDPSMDTGAGTMITCDISVANNITAIDADTGVASGTAVISVTECVGPANGRLDPNDLTCTTDAQTVASLVTAVDQCNEVGYGGGNVLECSVEVVNTFAGVTPAEITAATVNQCNGSATDTTGCTPFPATTTNATITQCNNSSYGGGQEDFICSAAGTTTATLNVTVNQCNNSNYGGGSWLTCSANVSNLVVAPAVMPTPALTTSPVPGLPDTATEVPFAAGNGIPSLLVTLLVLSSFAVIAGRTQSRREVRATHVRGH